MNFENTVKNYLIELKNEEILIDADITGVNEELKTSRCIATFLEDGVINEKYIYIYDNKGVLTWNIFNPIESEK